jgi:hypothetical protein
MAHVMNGEINLFKPTELFSRKLDQIKDSDPPGYGRIMKVIDRLLADPDDADGKMHGAYRGRFKKYVGRRDYRIIYYCCRRCRKENERLEKDCENCQAIPDNSVIFFDLYHKKDMKKFKKHN